ncbi:MAG: 1-acyl-sn-glycerol-3-phosphate acyltransferase [Candidatus Peribacteria bacterium]|jgi:1-acyl-sn-glycerol-3-phosphate acyltransferase|nr:1-acyl-sn-glycerol-3-phosphate acyltransferase [Candidatus Peribacteria bacterium]
MKQLAKIMLWLMGWNINVVNQRILTEKKYLLIAAPHTSSWDFIIGKMVYLALGIPSKFFIKKESFDGIFGGLLVALGGIPLNRENPRSFVEMINLLKREEMILIITPEGTRQATNQWRIGFYTMARKAKMPIFIGVLDYANKVCTLGQEFVITSDFETDMKQLYDVYHQNQAKYPEKFKKHGEI